MPQVCLLQKGEAQEEGQGQMSVTKFHTQE